MELFRSNSSQSCGPGPQAEVSHQHSEADKGGRARVRLLKPRALACGRGGRPAVACAQESGDGPAKLGELEIA